MKNDFQDAAQELAAQFATRPLTAEEIRKFDDQYGPDGWEAVKTAAGKLGIEPFRCLALSRI